MAEIRRLPLRRNGLTGYGYFSGSSVPSAGLVGAAETEAREAWEDEQLLHAVRLGDLDETARQQALALAEMMKKAEPTPFIYEAGAVYILRSQRCLAGMPWRAAAFEARAIVKVTLTNVGAVRPSWQDGQR